MSRIASAGCLAVLTILPISCPMVMIETRNRLIYLGDAEDCQQCIEDQMDALGGTLEKGLEANKSTEPPLEKGDSK